MKRWKETEVASPQVGSSWLSFGRASFVLLGLLSSALTCCPHRFLLLFPDEPCSSVAVISTWLLVVMVYIIFIHVEMLKWGYQEGTTVFGFRYDFRQSNRLQETLKRLTA